MRKKKDTRSLRVIISEDAMHAAAHLSTSPDPEEPRKPLFAKCVKCQHCWPAAYLPMELAVMAKVLSRVFCPHCGATPKHVVLARQSEGILLEKGETNA